MERKAYKFWFATGSQDLYGDECLRKVAEHSGIRSTESLCFIYIRSLIRRFPMTPLTWIS